MAHMDELQERPSWFAAMFVADIAEIQGGIFGSPEECHRATTES